ncbi:13745_t:CDS:2 [Acaulospora colombiana]|uniref:13745_t:CDS:1 n=1 Tax=Acaulospora colombiana TaxID=27376 RepID=A0ACA9MC48_9GLOM|nr:13745_t:CDS:2 [Acaulospora colombiana]
MDVERRVTGSLLCLLETSYNDVLCILYDRNRSADESAPVMLCTTEKITYIPYIYPQVQQQQINRIEELVSNLGKIANSTDYNNQNPPVIFGPEVVDFSKMDVNELVSFSSKLNAGLFRNYVTSEPEHGGVSSGINNRMNINAIINDEDN